MPPTDAAFWSDHLRQTLARYDEALLRLVAGRLVKPRGQWPVEELLDRCVAAVGNAAVIDRRLKELDPESRRLLALIAHSRQPCWKLGNLVELSVMLGHADGLAPLLALLEAGLLYPDLERERPARLPSFEQWLGYGGGRGLPVFAHPSVTARCFGEDLGLPECPAADARPLTGQEADGLEWPLRLAVVWQVAGAGPLRRTQQGEFFKRDLERLTLDARLNAPAAEGLAELPDLGLLAAELARLEGILTEDGAELRAADLPAHWQGDLAGVLAGLWAALPGIDSWDPHRGSRAGLTTSGNPYPSAYLLAVLLLTRLPDGAWALPADVESWIISRHPYWPARKPQEVGLRKFLLGIAYPLRLVEAGKDAAGEWLVRLSAYGRGLLGLGKPPPVGPEYVQTLLVQPNLEIVAYRQGLTPALVTRLSRFAAWTGLGPACTLQLQPASVYRAMEGGLTFEEILQTLEQRGMRPTPPAVVEALRTWSNKRERLTVYPAATLLEFASADDLNEALARGLPGVRLTNQLALVSEEGAIDFRHFRLTATRDYGLPPEQCVSVEDDGVTLAVDLARSDLFLESELRRFAEPAEAPSVNGTRRYRVTPATLAAGRALGLDAQALHDWFGRRVGRPLSAACQLLLTAAEASPPRFRRRLVLHLATPELTEGVCQWPGTRGLVQERLGPTTVAVAEDNAAALRAQLRALGRTVAE